MIKKIKKLIKRLKHEMIPSPHGKEYDCAIQLEREALWNCSKGLLKIAQDKKRKILMDKNIEPWF